MFGVLILESLQLLVQVPTFELFPFAAIMALIEVRVREQVPELASFQPSRLLLTIVWAAKVSVLGSFTACIHSSAVRVKCAPDDTVGDLKKLIAAQTGTDSSKIQLKKW